MISTLSEKQNEFAFYHDGTYSVASGAIRSGKTFSQLISWHIFLEGFAINRVKCLISGRTYPSVKSNIIDDYMAFIEMINEEKYYEYIEGRNPRLVYTPKGIECRVVGANDDAAEEKVRGATFQGWLADELTLHPESFVTHAVGRCSAGKRFKLLTCNPEGPGHYIKKNYINKIESGELKGKVFYFGLEDNPSLDEEYKNEIKKTYSGAFYERFILGRWCMASGVVYECFSRSKNIINDYTAPFDVNYVLGIDWGYNNPTAVLLIVVDSDENYTVIDEIYVKKQLIDNSFIKLMKEKGWFELKRDIYSTDIDAAYCDSNRPENIVLLSELAPFAVIGADKKPGSVLDGIQIVHQLFNTGRLKIHSKCVNLINEIENYRWKENKNQDKKDEPEKKDDHLCDALRYAIYTTITKRF